MQLIKCNWFLIQVIYYLLLSTMNPLGVNWLHVVHVHIHPFTFSSCNSVRVCLFIERTVFDTEQKHLAKTQSIIAIIANRIYVYMYTQTGNGTWIHTCLCSSYISIYNVWTEYNLFSRILFCFLGFLRTNPHRYNVSSLVNISSYHLANRLITNFSVHI